MRNILLMSFFSILLISSCQCNDGEDGMNNDMEDTTANTNGTYGDDMSSTDDNSSSSGNEYISGATNQEENDRMVLMFNYETYPEADIIEYRKTHDNTDYGNVPGYYPEASTRALEEDDVKYLTEWGHKVMLNEIYARHGKIFQDPDLNAHFTTQGWYSAEHNNVQDMLTMIEKRNIEYLKNNPPKPYNNPPGV